ncbi:MAG: DnaJ domain-containing protein [Acidimicrobiales bacterium]
MGTDPFEILGIARDATRREAEAAYRRLAELFHPDRLQGLRADVRAEGERRLAEATDALRVVRDRLERPLRAQGHERETKVRAPEPPASPVLARHRAETPDETSPSDAATEDEAHVYEVALRCIAGPTLQARWYGRHAAATLAALRHAHRRDGGAIRQIEWGAYEVVLDGAATRRLLRSALGDEELQAAVEITATADGALPVPYGHRWPGGGGPTGAADLDAVVELLLDDGRYELIADVY